MSPLLQFFAIAIAVYVGRLVLSALLEKPALENVLGPKSEAYVTGNMGGVLGQDRWTYLRSLVAQYGRVFKIHGVMSAPWLYTVDPLSLHSIFVKDHDVYEENAMHVILMNLTLGPGLLSTLGQQHRRQRKMLNPLFSAKQLRDVTPIFNDVVHRLQEALAERIKAGAEETDMLGWMGRMALELIGQAGLGTSFDTFADAKTDEYAEAIKAFFPTQLRMEWYRWILPFVSDIGPTWLRRAIVRRIPISSLRRMIQLSDALHERSLAIVNEKRAALEQGDEALKDQVGQGKDIMSVLLRANTSAAPEDRLSDEEVVAQVTTMALAGMDTTSNAMARVLHLLSEHPDIQQQLREEIMHARDDGTGKLRDLDYDEVMGLPFLDAVCRETLRCYAPITLVMREVLKDAVLPLSEPIRGVDGQMIDAIPVKKGMCILLDLLQSNCDPTVWGDDAYEWQPERWLKPLPQAVEESRVPGVYSHMMTFIGGSRACIGFKFSQLEIKLALASLLPSFKFEPSTSSKPIHWVPAAIAYPTTDKVSAKPEMPLKVTLI